MRLQSIMRRRQSLALSLLTINPPYKGNNGMQRKHIIRLTAMMLAVTALAAPAAAQDLSPIQNMLESVEAALTGPIGISVATLAVIGTGFMCMMGRLNWGWFASVIIGIVLIFSAGTIVSGFA